MVMSLPRAPYHPDRDPWHLRHARPASRGRREGPCRAVDVRRHRAALRPGEPDHDVPDGRAVAAPDGRLARARGLAHGCSTSPAGPATCAASSPPPASRPVGVDLSFGMLAAARTAAPLVQADALRLPVPDATCRRRHVRVRAAQLRRARRRSSPSWRGSCGPADASRCSRWPSRRTRSCGGATALLRPASCRASAACCPIAAAYRYLPRSVAYLPGDRGDARLAPRGGLRRRRAAAPLRRDRAADHRDQERDRDRGTRRSDDATRR